MDKRIAEQFGMMLLQILSLQEQLAAVTAERDSLRGSVPPVVQKPAAGNGNGHATPS